MPLNYALEAARYDETRGGEARAMAAAAAVGKLLPHPGILLDVAGGTGIVSRQLSLGGHQVVVTDLVVEMLRPAEHRLPGAAIAMDAGKLALADSSVDAVTMIWFLHLVADIRPMLAEAARVLRAGGRLVTTVDKRAANGVAEEDPRDARNVIVDLGRSLGLHLAGETSFVGVGQRDDPVYPLLAFVRSPEHSPC
jgi:ubiquinone/menaquinone biosynthesis C-methylase UbiE